MTHDEVTPTEGSVELDRVVLDASGNPRYTVRELRGRASLIEPRIALMREIDGGTRETLSIMGAAVEELVKEFDAFGIVVDLSDASGATTSDYRRFIPEFFDGLHARSLGRLRLIGVAFVGNPVVRIATKFLVGRMSDVPLSIQKSRAHALEVVRAALRSTS